MKSLAKTLFFCIVFAGAASLVSAQIDQAELERNLAPVSFTSYEGPHARIETREQIRQIGVGLGQAVKAGSAQTGTPSRYFVIHSVSDPDGDKLDADIFGLGPGTGVDHIRNLRTIIQGYLQEAYDYSASDAALLAEYITIYNAVYRGNWDYFTGRYKAPVISHLNQRQVGLSTRYNEWPGNTLMVIPLGTGGISSIDTSAISDGRVVEEMRREDDMSIEQRRDMVDLKEREADAAEQSAATQRAAIAQEEGAISQGRAQVDSDRQQAAQDRQQLQQDQAAGTVTPADAAQRQTAITQQEAAADQQSAALDQRESQLNLQRDQATQQEQLAQQKTDEAQQDRASIAQDQQTVINQQAAAQTRAAAQPLIGIIIEKQGATSGRPVTIDPSTKSIARRSALDTVYVRTLTFIGSNIIAIAGEAVGNGAVRLIQIDSSTLGMAKQGDDDLSPASLIWVNGNDLYAITANLSNNTFNLGRFSTDLSLQAKSAVTIHPNATVIIQQGSLLTQKADGSAAFLDPATLAEK